MNFPENIRKFKIKCSCFSCLTFNFRFVESILSATAMKARFLSEKVVNFELFAFVKIEDETGN